MDIKSKKETVGQLKKKVADLERRLRIATARADLAFAGYREAAWELTELKENLRDIREMGVQIVSLTRVEKDNNAE
jgi:hypothetical protein